MSQPASPISSRTSEDSPDRFLMANCLRFDLTSRPRIVNGLANRAVDYALMECQKKAENHRLPVPYNDAFIQTFSARIRESVEIGLRVVSNEDLDFIEEKGERLWTKGFFADAENYSVEFRRVLDRVFPVVKRSSEQIDRDLEPEFSQQAEEDQANRPEALRFEELSLKKQKAVLVQDEDGFFRVGRATHPKPQPPKTGFAENNYYSLLVEEDHNQKTEKTSNHSKQAIPQPVRPPLNHPFPPGYHPTSLVESTSPPRLENFSQPAAYVQPSFPNGYVPERFPGMGRVIIPRKTQIEQIDLTNPYSVLFEAESEESILKETVEYFRDHREGSQLFLGQHSS